ncbi:MAG: hypothetical protein U9N33_03650, partial [Campylobacterota bacterium]|nr:hypothetical protein [Campylobacterota bacterium]
MLHVVGKITNLDGKFYAKSEDGSLRELSQGDKIYEGETIVGDSGNSSADNITVNMLDSNEEMLIVGTQAQLFDSSLLSDEFAENETVTDMESMDLFLEEMEDVDVEDIDTEAGDTENIVQSVGGEAEFADANNASVDINATLRDNDFDSDDVIYSSTTDKQDINLVSNETVITEKEMAVENIIPEDTHNSTTQEIVAGDMIEEEISTENTLDEETIAEDTTDEIAEDSVDEITTDEVVEDTVPENTTDTESEDTTDEDTVDEVDEDTAAEETTDEQTTDAAITPEDTISENTIDAVAEDTSPEDTQNIVNEQTVDESTTDSIVEDTTDAIINTPFSAEITTPEATVDAISEETTPEDTQDA